MQGALCPFHGQLGFCESLPCPLATSHQSDTTATSDDSIFFRLPRELREAIYKLVLSYAKLTLSINDGQISLLQDGVSKHNLLALTAVCRRTRREAMPLFFSENAFFVPVLAFDDVHFASNRSQTERLRRSSSLSWLERDAFGSITAFQLSQQEWTDGFKSWLGKIGPANAASLRRVEIALGNWHLNKPTRFDADIGSALATIRRSLRNPEIECETTMRVGIPNAQPQPCVVQLRLPITNEYKAVAILDEFFGKVFRHIDDLSSHGKITDSTNTEIELAVLTCQQRLHDFVSAIYAPAPPWSEDSTADIAEHLRSAELNHTIGSSQQKQRSQLNEECLIPRTLTAQKRLSALPRDERRLSRLAKEENRRSHLSGRSEDERRLSRLAKEEHRRSQFSGTSNDERRLSCLAKEEYRRSYLSGMSREERRQSRMSAAYSLYSYLDSEHSSDWEDLDAEEDSLADNISQVPSDAPSKIYIPQAARVVTYRRIEQEEVRLKQVPPVELPAYTTPKAERYGRAVFSEFEATPRRVQREMVIDSLPDQLSGRASMTSVKTPWPPVSIETYDLRRERTAEDAKTQWRPPTPTEVLSSGDRHSPTRSTGALLTPTNRNSKGWKSFMQHVRTSAIGGLGMGMDPGATAAMAAHRQSQCMLERQRAAESI